MSKGIWYNEKANSREFLLPYPNLNKPFEIHTDVSKLQLGSVKWCL